VVGEELHPLMANLDCQNENGKSEAVPHHALSVIIDPVGQSTVGESVMCLPHLQDGSANDKICLGSGLHSEVLKAWYTEQCA
jgi:hypothetical protein